MDEEKKLAIYIFVIYITMTGLNLWNDSNKKLPNEILTKNQKSLENFFMYYSYEGNWSKIQKIDKIKKNEKNGEIIDKNKKIDKSGKKIEIIDKNKKNENLIFQNLLEPKDEILENKEGLIKMKLNYRINLLSKLSISKFFLNLKIYDPKYSDGRILRIKQHLQFEEKEDSIILENVKNDRTLINNFYIFENSKLIKKKTCKFVFNLKLNKNLIKKKSLKTSKFSKASKIFNFSLKSEKFDSDCNFSISGNFKIIPIYKKNIKEMIYNFFIITVITLSFYGALKMIKKMGNNINSIKKISLNCIELICCQDSFILFFNLQMGTIIHNTFNFFFIFFFYFLLFCFIDQRILSFVWQNKINFENPLLNQRQIQKKSYIYQFKIIFLIIIYNYFMFRFLMNPILIILNSLILLPQIYHNIKSRSISCFDKNFIFFYTSSAYLFFFYFRAIPQNIIDLKPEFREAFIGLVFLTILIFVLYLQDIYGAKFLIPKFLKNQYNYFISLKKYKSKVGKGLEKKKNKKKGLIKDFFQKNLHKGDLNREFAEKNNGFLIENYSEKNDDISITNYSEKNQNLIAENFAEKNPNLISQKTGEKKEIKKTQIFSEKNNNLMDSVNTTFSQNSESPLFSEISVNTDTCTICLDDLENECAENSIKNKNFKRIFKKIRKGVVMCPPCNHGFHPACLLQWMEIKMECPYCKSTLPQID